MSDIPAFVESIQRSRLVRDRRQVVRRVAIKRCLLFYFDPPARGGHSLSLSLSSCNFLSPSDVFARTRENHVKPRFKAVIYVNETLTTSTKFYSPELTLGPPRHTPRVSYSSYFFLCLYLVTSLDTKETKKKREKEEVEEEEEQRMARKLFFPATERSLRNDRVLKLTPLRFHLHPRIFSGR